MSGLLLTCYDSYAVETSRVSHVRAGIKFSVRLIEKFLNAYISVYTFGPLAAQANAYLATHPKVAHERTRIVASVVGPPVTNPLDLVFSLESSFKLWISQQLEIASFEAGGHVVAPPSYIIEDHINGGVALGHGLLVASWWAAPAASLIAHFGNPDHGHGGRLLDSIGAALAKQEPGAEKPIEEIFHEVLSDRVVCIPGLPAFYEHEQILQVLSPVLPLLRCSVGLMRWNQSRLKLAFTKPARPFGIGPSVDLPPAPPANPDSTIEFLDKAYSELGPHSVINTSFGTLFFPLPQSARRLEIIGEETMAHGFRLVFGLSSEQAAVSEELIGRMTKAGRAIFPKWTNQLKVLEHQAIHYFLSHGGWNSMVEVIVRDVPMIIWPFAADQPTNTLQVATQHDCAFELIQVRTGAARTTTYRNIPVVGTDKAVQNEIKHVLEISKGARGKQQRINVKALGRIMRESIGKGESADIALGEFGRLIGL
ncbi:hypothetical protein FS749_006208 [Ceratobasidium sp. UAMH 11750]|nr:hypothetical protein FS749_006208 [Ceratobasidium sp. UAMH 11750]